MYRNEAKREIQVNSSKNHIQLTINITILPTIEVKHLMLCNYILLLHKDMNSLYSIKSLLFRLLPTKIVHVLLSLLQSWKTMNSWI